MSLRCPALLTLICSHSLAMVAAPARAEEASADDLIAAPARVGDPSAEDLLRLAPFVTSSDVDCRSIEVRGFLKADGARVKFRAIYRAPNRHALFISDGRDDTPIFSASDRKLCLYDPVRSVVLYATDTISSFHMVESDNCWIFNFSWAGLAKKEDSSKISLDTKTLFRGRPQAYEAVKTGKGKYRLTRILEKGSLLVSRVDLALKQPYKEIELFGNFNRDYHLRIDKLVIDGPLEDLDFAFPSKDTLSAKIAVKDYYPADGMLANFDGFESTFRACEARLAAIRPELRESITAPDSAIDWDEVRKNDDVFSRVLKDLIPSRTKTP